MEHTMRGLFDSFHAFRHGRGHAHGHGHGFGGHHHPHHVGGHGHRGFHGFGFGRGEGFPGDPARGGGGLGPGRKLGSADLQLLILALLAEQPRHGYEIIKALSERSNGYYSPSPGMVYPALTYLDEIGHASVEAEGTKKLYSVTVAGLSHLDENRAAADTLLQQLAWIGQRMDKMRAAFGGNPDGTEAAGPEGSDPFAGGRGRRGMPAELREAMRAVGEAMQTLRGASADEQKRIAAILVRAASEIRGDKP
jgi:DNA-binding PadR family transcriptional regulator